MTPFYEHNGITIYHGDCREILLALTERFDLLLTDPPYGILDHGGKWGKKRELQWDDVPPHQAIYLAITQSDDAIIWGGNYFSLPPSRGWLVWHKPDQIPSAANCELAWTSLDMNTRWMSWSIAATNGERNGHPTQKPEAVMRWCLMQCPDAQTILDPFMGSGTTLVAAKRLGRQCVGIEREEKYCEIAVKRLAQEALPLEMGA